MNQSCLYIVTADAKELLIITSGKLAREVNDLMNIIVHDKEKGWARISEVITSALNQKAHES